MIASPSSNATPVAPEAFRAFRATLFAYAVVLALAAVWTAVPAAIQPKLPFFPTSQDEIDLLARHQQTAGIAARVALVRGDLWSVYALTLLAKPPASATADPNATDAYRPAWYGARLAPGDPRPWLLLAEIATGQDGNAERSAALLKMSYLTGSHETALMPLRVAVAAWSGASRDPDLLALVRHDGEVIGRDPKAEDRLRTIYRQAAPLRRTPIRQLLASIDPALAARIDPGP